MLVWIIKTKTLICNLPLFVDGNTSRLEEILDNISVDPDPEIRYRLIQLMIKKIEETQYEIRKSI